MKKKSADNQESGLMGFLKNRYVKKTLEFLALAISMLFIGKFLWTGWPQLVTHIEYAKWSYLFYGICLFLGYFFLRSLAWWYMMSGLGGRMEFSKAGYIWFLSEFSRYIPGNVWSFVGRVYLCDKEKIPKRITSLGLVLEIFYLLGASLSLGLVFFVTGSPIIKLPIWSGIIILPIIITIINPKILGKIINKLLRLLKKGEIDFQFGFGQSIIVFLLYIGAWLAYGLGSYMIAAAFVDLSHISIFWLICSFVLSWAIGYMSFITPMGLGIREAVIVTILKTVISGPLASLVAVASRIFMIISELIALGFVLLSKKLREFKASEKMKIYIKKNKASFALMIMVIVYIGYFTTVTFLRHSNYLTSRYDLGNMDQTVWNTAHNNFFQLTNPEIGTQISRFFIHGDIFLILFAPLYWIYSSPYILLFVQTVVVALGALPIFWLGKDILKNNKLALMIAFAYLMYPGTQWANLFDFHSVTLATSFLTFAFYFMYKKKYIPFVIFALLALMTKETIALVLVLMAIYIILIQKKWKIGLAVGAISLAWFGLLLWKIMPEARLNADSHFALTYYKNFGNGPGDILKNLIVHPYDTFKYVKQNNRFDYLLEILKPTGFLALFSPFIIFASPPVAINILSDQTQMRMINYHYTSDIAPFLFISMVFSARFIIKSIHRRVKIYGKKISNNLLEKIFLIYIFIMTIFYSWQFSPLPLAKNADIQALGYHNPAKKYLDELRITIPESATVSATNRMSPHFTNRKISYLFPNGIGVADYIIVEDGYQFELISPQNVHENIIRLRSDNRYIRIYNNNNVEVFRKR